MGKESVWHDHTVHDPELAKMLIERKEKAGDGGQLFATNETKVGKAMKKLDGGIFTSKDCRTQRANLKAISTIKGMPQPQSEDEYKAAVLQVGDVVSRLLGNDRDMALASYIDPTVFVDWEKNIPKSQEK